MTKTFEEELKDREAETFSYWDGCTISKKEFINYADVVNLSEGWVSPEEYEKLVKNCAVYVLECKNINRVNAQLTKENEDLKSQLQQQALPVVRGCPVGAIGKNGLTKEEIEGSKGLEKSIASILNGEEHKCTPECFEKHVIKAIRFGYTVEKPQLFYLKDNLTGMYLYKIMIAYNEGIKGYKWDTPTKKGLGAGNYKFTQSEIDSMQTGSYEQIEVEK